MKFQLKSGIANKRTPAVLCVFAGVCLLATAMTYHEITSTLNSSDRAGELTSRLLVAEQYNALLRYINNGKEADAKNFLKSGLEYNLKEISELTPKVEAQRQLFAQGVVKVIERQEQKPAPYRLASNQRSIVATVVSP
jgi:hypothetical protein